MATISENPNIKNDLSIGTILKNERIRKAIDTKAVAYSLKVKETDIIDLESGEIFTKKPAIYINGLIKTYGALLKIDKVLIKEKTKNLLTINYKFDKFRFISISKNNKFLPKKNYFYYALSIIFLFYFLSFCIFKPQDRVTTEVIINNLSDNDND